MTSLGNGTNYSNAWTTEELNALAYHHVQQFIMYTRRVKDHRFQTALEDRFQNVLTE